MTIPFGSTNRFEFRTDLPSATGSAAYGGDLAKVSFNHVGRCQDGVGYRGCLTARTHVVNPYQVRTGQDGGGDGCQRGISPAIHRDIHSLIERRQGSTQKSLARDACQQRLSQAAQFLQAREQ